MSGDNLPPPPPKKKRKNKKEKKKRRPFAIRSLRNLWRSIFIVLWHDKHKNRQFDLDFAVFTA